MNVGVGGNLKQIVSMDGESVGMQDQAWARLGLGISGHAGSGLG